MFAAAKLGLPRTHLAARKVPLAGRLHGPTVVATRHFSRTVGEHPGAVTQAPSNNEPRKADAGWGIILDQYRALNRKSEKPETPDDIWASMHDRNFKTLPPPADPWAGRRVHVQNGNVAQAIAALNRRLNHNNVQRTSVYQRRHEKRGYRRRRLQAQKWRRMFAYEVRQKVALVQKIRKRGG